MAIRIESNLKMDLPRLNLFLLYVNLIKVARLLFCADECVFEFQMVMAMAVLPLQLDVIRVYNERTKINYLNDLDNMLGTL